MMEKGPPESTRGEIWEMLEASKRRQQARQGLDARFNFLADPRDLASLSLDAQTLAAMEALAREKVARLYRDPLLSAFTLALRPFARSQSEADEALFTYSSPSANRRATLRVDRYGFAEPASPSEDALALAEPSFPAPPWEAQPQWPDLFRRACASVGPLSPHEFTACYLSARARFAGRWEAIFQDGATGRESIFEWTGAGELTRRK